MNRMIVSRKSMLPFILSALIPGAQAAKVGQSYIVSGRCVTVTQIEKGQAEYKWSSGNASGSGNLPANRLTQSCNAPPPAATPTRGATESSGVKPATGSLALTPAEAKAMVDAHNALRAQIGVGPVTWDPTIAAFAQGHVATLGTSCEDSHSGSDYGENLAVWRGAGSPTQAVAIWATEKPAYHGGGGPFNDADSRAAGHYTQMVWRNSIRIGCGRVACSIKGVVWTLVSCNYSPSGNEIGAPVY